MSSGTGRAALPGSDTPAANGSVLSPGTTLAAADSQSALPDSGLLSYVRNLLGNSLYSASANPISDSLTAAARNLLDSFRGTVSRYAAQSREPLLAGGPQWYEENEPGGWIEESETEEPTQATNSTGKELTGEQTNGRVEEENVPKIKLTMPTLPRGSKPIGDYARIPNSKDAISYQLQNEAADIMADAGFEVHILREVKGGNGYGLLPDKNPDFLIGPNVFDCYSPIFAPARNVHSNVVKKTEEQSRRILLNLNKYQFSVDELRNQFLKYRIATLDELFVIINGKIYRWFP